MYNDTNCPIGTDTPQAPWNQAPYDKRDFDVVVSQILSKDTKVSTDKYQLKQDDFNIPYADTSDTEWLKEYHNDRHYTPLELIRLFQNFLELHIQRFSKVVDVARYKHLIEECSGWTDDETNILEV